MPKDGGLDNQDAEWVEAMQVVESAHRRVERETQEEEALKARRGAKMRRL